MRAAFTLSKPRRTVLTPQGVLTIYHHRPPTCPAAAESTPREVHSTTEHHRVPDGHPLRAQNTAHCEVVHHQGIFPVHHCMSPRRGAKQPPGAAKHSRAFTPAAPSNGTQRRRHTPAPRQESTAKHFETRLQSAFQRTARSCTRMSARVTVGARPANCA